MRLQKLTKKQIKEALDQQPMHQLLQVEKSKLTNKQIKFCEELALGSSKAEAYRRSHNSKAKPSTQANNGYRMAKRDDIQAMTDAIKQGLEFQRLYSAGQIRALVVQRLTQEAISEDSNPSVRVNALKALGTIAGVDAFVHRSETKVIKDSDKARAELMEMLKQSMAENARTIDSDDNDILELLAEINPPPVENSQEPEIDPHQPDSKVGVPTADIHSTPDTRLPLPSSSEVNQKKIEENQ